jgi:hypothetical protein
MQYVKPIKVILVVKGINARRPTPHVAKRTAGLALSACLLPHADWLVAWPAGMRHEPYLA